MQIHRTALAAVVIAAAAAAPAPASVAVDTGTQSLAPQTAAPTRDPSRFAEMAAHREAISNRQWQQAESAPVVALVRSDGDGFEWPSALIGGTVPLALVLVGFVARSAITRRRTRASALA